MTIMKMNYVLIITLNSYHNNYSKGMVIAPDIFRTLFSITNLFLLDFEIGGIQLYKNTWTKT